MQRSIIGSGLWLACTLAAAQTLQQGQPAPPAVLEQLKETPVTQIGSQRVRPVPPPIASKQAEITGPGTASSHTLVVRDSDHLVGISSNELVVVTADLDSVVAQVARLGLAGVSVQTFPKLQLALIKTARFEQIEPIRNDLAARFPQAKFDLPVRYFPRQRH